MKIKSAVYKTSVVDGKDILKEDIFEFAFVGRSNVGKSSLINALVGQKKLAKTSSTPGLTKMINYFLINDSFYFVDLPGYGYAKVEHDKLKIWGSLMGGYLERSDKLLTVFVLVDVRIDPSELDHDMVEYLNFHQIPYRVVATKCDKISKSALSLRLKAISESLNLGKEIIIPTSSENKAGVDRLLDYIGATLEMAQNESKDN